MQAPSSREDIQQLIDCNCSQGIPVHTPCRGTPKLWVVAVFRLSLQSLCILPSRDSDVQSPLFIEPEVLGDPIFGRIDQAQVEFLEHEWDEFVNLAERDLRRTKLLVWHC